jgi:tetratricopeptide (TPR) repeat protein
MTTPLDSRARAIARVYLQANKLSLKKEDQQALALYLEVAGQIADNAELAATVANCYFGIALTNPRETGENHKEAISWMKRALALDPDNARLHGRLAQFYELGLLEEELAAQEYRKAIELNPYDVWTLFNATSLYGVPEEVVTLDEAINWLERVIWLEPDDPNFHLRLGDLYHKAGRISDAEREWLRALLCPRPLNPGPAQAVKTRLGIEED